MCGCDLGNFSGTEQMLFHMVCGCGQELPEAGGSSYSQLTSLDFLHVLKKMLQGKSIVFQVDRAKNAKLSRSNLDPVADPDCICLGSLKQPGITPQSLPTAFLAEVGACVFCIL